MLKGTCKEEAEAEAAEEADDREIEGEIEFSLKDTIPSQSKSLVSSTSNEDYGRLANQQAENYAKSLIFLLHLDISLM